MENIQKLIEQVTDLAHKNKYSQNFIEFTENFFAEMQSRDFKDYTIEEMLNLAKLSFDFFQTKKPGEFKIKIDNSHNKKDNYTILEVVNDDMPFLVDSMAIQIEKLGIKVKNALHPIYTPKRDKNHKLTEVNGGLKAESVIQFHLSAITDKESEILETQIKKTLETVKLVVEDFKVMSEFVAKLGKEISKNKIGAEEGEEFFEWLNQGNFIFLGVKEFEVKEKAGKFTLVPNQESALGVFKSPYEEFVPSVKNFANSNPKEVEDSIKKPYVLEILKSRYKSQIHRNTMSERIRVQKFSDSGEVIGEYRIIGLFTNSAYSQTVTEIPRLRKKIAYVIKESGFVKGSHNYKDLISTIESYPRDELFQSTRDDLLRITRSIVLICGRNEVRFFARRDKFDRFVSCLIFTPRERSNSELRDKIREYLSKKYNGYVVDSFVQITESNLTRLHIIIRTDNKIPNVDEEKIEQEISEMTKIYSDALAEEIKLKFGEEQTNELFRKYKNAFSVSYKNRFDARRAAIDISRIEECLQKNEIIFNLYKSSAVEKEISELKIYSPQKELILSEVMPILESFGFNVIHEHTYQITFEKNSNVWIHYFRLNLSKSGTEFNEEIKKDFEDTISLICCGVVDIGFLNRLVVSSKLSWKEVYMLRAYMRYLYQAGYRYNQTYVADILVKNSKITNLLVELFETKFNPKLKLSHKDRYAEIEKVSNKIKNELNKVSDASHDLAIRKFFGVINATLRTNFYQTSELGHFKGYLSFKFDCKKVPDLPLPLPYAEIFVYSKDVEGVHLRGGRVARGGLRWSDRQEDFRTEVLGLVKAQMTKNAVIVPVGSKGGFVVKKDTSGMTRDEFLQEGIKCYKTFLRGLLDLTDNVVNNKIVHPNNVVMHDDSDPYLVVAADKGTATFSDIANSISAEYNFWLGDAFASGGSVGYDHKKMGITAKGAWISVKRHFREMGIDTQSEDFTVAGIGDMAGDVFGNGMLLSPHIKLVAAFNHMHIFLDPNPDAKKSFAERERMFNLSRSTWMDYDKSLISKGGGIFERSAKSIKLTEEVKKLLAVNEDEMSPNALLTAILKSPVDLLWNGGIGTYVKAMDESNEDVGDRANDAIRINGNELCAKVIGEGGNLGFTQKGRIEYALNGGRINTDAMDNSAGVDCSDHEVNIKIALTAAMRDKKITLEERNKILEKMTDNVSHLVLEDNRLQTQAITIAQSQGSAILSSQAQFISSLEKSGLLNRQIEFLPSKKEIAKRQMDKVGLTRPELCVLLAYSKMDIYNRLLSSKLVDDEYFTEELISYFPELMQKKFAEEIENHQLRREIIATQITNFTVNHVGIHFINQIASETGFSTVEVIRSFIIACDSFGLRKVWQEIEELNNDVAPHIQTQMFVATLKLLERSILWLLRGAKTSGGLTKVVERFRKIATELAAILPKVLAEASKDSYERKIERYCLNNVEEKLAAKVASFDPIASVFDIAEISEKSKLDLKTIAKIYFAVGTRFSLKWLRSKISDIQSDDYWQRLSGKTIIEDLYSYQMKIATQIVDHNCDQKDCDLDEIEEWISTVNILVERYDNFISELKIHPNPDLSMFVVALNRLKPLVG